MPGEGRLRHRARRSPGLRPPVVALARGGALETVTDGDTGVLFAEPTAESLADALRRWPPVVRSGRIRASAERFSRDRHAGAMQA